MITWETLTVDGEGRVVSTKKADRDRPVEITTLLFQTAEERRRAEQKEGKRKSKDKPGCLPPSSPPQFNASEAGVGIGPPVPPVAPMIVQQPGAPADEASCSFPPSRVPEHHFHPKSSGSEVDFDFPPPPPSDSGGGRGAGAATKAAEQRPKPSSPSGFGKNLKMKMKMEAAGTGVDVLKQYRARS
mmetsp:Transcript_3190/g.7515  ORF Transcript_3190/g.7515 Transcript_3190/m.7515 type:complete len:186 (-) Transcript_3190:469-1026(-)